MTHLREHTSVRGSLSETESRLESYFASQRASDGVARLRLRVPITGQERGLCVDREVWVEAWRDRDDLKLNELIRVTWTPEGKVAFPKFSGTLVVSGDGDPSRSHVELDGTYEPPLGAAGESFDAVIGRKLAESTAREFLEEVKRGVENLTSE